MANICIIPARGGSKRIPKKNLKNFLGNPIISYPIKLAIESNLFDEIIVSTDNHEIAEIAINYGAKVPFFRSNKNSNDFATTFDVIEEVLSFYKSNGNQFQNGCCIYPCTPLINVKRLIESYERLTNGSFDVVFPVIKYSTPIQRAFKIKNDFIYFIEDKNKNMRSQDLEPSYYDAGQFYWFKTLSILKKKTLITNNVSSIILDEIEAQDIDNENDWKMAEMKFMYLNGNKEI